MYVYFKLLTDELLPKVQIIATSADVSKRQWRLRAREVAVVGPPPNQSPGSDA